MTNDPTQLDITRLAELLRSRQTSSVDLTRAYLERIDRLNPRLNAYITVTAEAALQQARAADAEIARGNYRGPLHGVPVGIKDLFDVGGAPTTFGSKILKDNQARQDSAVVARLKRAGAVILGKHNLHEFAFGITSENPHFGAVRNPWDTDRIPGGSSGGTAAAVAAGLCAAGIGSDTGASIRAPASFCGIVGLKPTYGRVSRVGGLPLAWSLDHAGPMTRSVADCALMLQAIAGPDPTDPGSADVPVPDFSEHLQAGVRGLRVGVPNDYFFDVVEPDVDRSVRDAIRVLESLGARVYEVRLPHALHAQVAGNVIMSTEAAAWHGSWLRERADDYGADVLARIRGGQLIRAVDYLASQQMRTLIQDDFRQAFQDADVVVAPTVPLVAPPIGRTLEPGGPLNLAPRSIANRATVPCNLTGMPAISIPCGVSGGLPVGLQIMGPAFSEPLVLRVAAAYEAATPWRSTGPPLN
ncbi:MAG: Asp-tRNA(Asn)/Glu-tRNA(Gln) amidotransferase subunit GatA [Chloroflexi bacterium]|nr:Asp-tRNA(Asn)/Glu-tRNA(Gln) amidotransferase subunit GatA [Chloroflexota bacterium]